MTARISPEDAQDALESVARAGRQIADEVGMPRRYWWGMAGGWLALGVIADVGPSWLSIAATLLFGAGHAALASRLLDGRSRTHGVRVSAAVAGHRTPVLVLVLLLALVALTVGVALALHADGMGHPATAAAVLTAAIVGFGGPDLLRVLRRAFGA